MRQNIQSRLPGIDDTFTETAEEDQPTDMSPTATLDEHIVEVDYEEEMLSLREAKNPKIVEIQDIESQYISQGTQGS